jgi:DNA alkylation repair enzyme
MAKRRITPEYIAAHIRRVLKDGGSAPHAQGVQSFFKEEIKSRGWHTAEMRKVALRLRRTILRERDLKFLLKVADRLFRGRVLEEKIFAVFLLEKLTDDFSDAEFSLFESWLPRISSWADRKGSGGCCGRRRSTRLRRQFPISTRFASALPASSCERPARRCRLQSARGSSQHERLEPFRAFRSHGHARFLRPGESQSVVHPGIRAGLPSRIRLRIPAGSMAIRNCRSGLGIGCIAPLATGGTASPEIGRRALAVRAKARPCLQ